MLISLCYCFAPSLMALRNVLPNRAIVVLLCAVSEVMYILFPFPFFARHSLNGTGLKGDTCHYRHELTSPEYEITRPVVAVWEQSLFARNPQSPLVVWSNDRRDDHLWLIIKQKRVFAVFLEFYLHYDSFYDFNLRQISLKQNKCSRLFDF